MPSFCSESSNCGTEAQELLVLLFAAEAHHVLDAGAVVPAAVEQDDLAGRGQARRRSGRSTTRPLPLGRRREGRHAAGPRVQELDDPLDHPVLAGRVAALEHHDELAGVGDDPLLHVDELGLQAQHLLLVALAGQLLRGAHTRDLPRRSHGGVSARRGVAWRARARGARPAAVRTARRASADAARRARLAGGAGARRARHAGAERRAPAAPPPGLPVVRARADRAELAVAAAVPAGRRTPRDRPVQPRLPRTGQGGQGQVDLLAGRRRRGDLQGKAHATRPATRTRSRRSCSRRRSRASGTAASSRPCCRKRTSRSTPRRPTPDSRSW